MSQMQIPRPGGSRQRSPIEQLRMALLSGDENAMSAARERFESSEDFLAALSQMDLDSRDMDRLLENPQGLDSLYNLVDCKVVIDDDCAQFEQENLQSLESIGRALVDVLMVGLDSELTNWEKILSDVPTIKDGRMLDELEGEPDVEAAGDVGKIMAQHGVLPRMVLLGSDGLSLMLRNLLRDEILVVSEDRPIRLLNQHVPAKSDHSTVPFREAALEVARVTGTDLRRAQPAKFRHIDDVPLPTATALLNWFFDVVPSRRGFFRAFHAERSGQDLRLRPAKMVEDYLLRWKPA